MPTHLASRVMGHKRWRGQKVEIFQQTAANIQERIMGAQHFNTAAKFAQNGLSFSRTFRFFGRKFSNKLKFRGARAIMLLSGIAPLQDPTHNFTQACLRIV